MSARHTVFAADDLGSENSLTSHLSNPIILRWSSLHPSNSTAYNR